MKKRLFQFFILCICSLFIVTACDLMGSEESDPTPVPTSTPTPLVTPTPISNATPVPTPTLPPVDPTVNMLRNADFSNDDEHWWTYENDGQNTELVLDASTGEAVLTFTQAGSDLWACGIGQTISAPFEKGELYELTLEAWGSEREIRFGTQEGGVDLDGDDSIYTNYEVRDVNIGLTAQTYSMIFKMHNPTDPQPMLLFWLGQDAGNVHIDNVVLKETGITVDPYVNLFINGDFSYGDDLWYMHGFDETGITKTIESGVAHLTFSQVGTDPWDNGFTYYGFQTSIENGKTYRISLDAWGSDREIRFVLQENERDLNADDSEWSPYCTFYPTLTSTEQTFNYLFQMSNPTDDDSSFAIHMAQDTGDVYLDNIILKEVNMTGYEFVGEWVESPSDADSDVAEFFPDGTVNFWNNYACTDLNGTGLWDVTNNTFYLYNGLDVQVYTLNIIDNDTCQLLQGGSVMMTQYRKGTEP